MNKDLFDAIDALEHVKEVKVTLVVKFQGQLATTTWLLPSLGASVEGVGNDFPFS